MRNDLDYGKITEAEALVEQGDQIASVNCMCCQGHSLEGKKEGQPGYCPSCHGTCSIDEPAWRSWAWKAKIDYWQARAMIAEMALEGKAP